MSEIEKNSLVRILSTEKTNIRHGLDSGGEMKSMVGKVLRTADVSGTNVYIENARKSFTYAWDARDLEAVEEKEPDPIIFKFDEKQLTL